ncbi:Predicted protein tyrosine phosphatase [Rubritalea squalenifaciens DSM 18772]|uniref:Tyrosine specific protein phosphatases domain-containing protein n=2 Tax=Rubritalea TaxID=361050 RepID=A0A1M6D8D4_9BACT|nr:dual specificity protein phosphatase family protein [Rubritalea squalenifaciens]SHI69497.1 Predicted protein tyrosine phosphatase [Rubritalea squalenifaciens DSM 18772]
MQLPQISICGVVDFNKIDPKSYTHVISIWHPNPNLERFQKQVRLGFEQANILFCTYNDVETLEHSIQAPTSNDVGAALDYALELPEDAHLLVHCMAGISRSTATAMAIIAQALGEGSEREAAVTVREIRPIANPNRLILQYADDLLERNGALLEAAEEVFGPSLGEINKGWS